MVFVDEDSNYLHAEKMKSRAAGEHTSAFRRGYEYYKASGFPPQIERLDNEMSQKLLDEMQNICGVKVELVPASNHRALKAERAMRTVKDHMISCFATADPEFPMVHWDRTEQPEKVLNMMRGSNINPRISAYEQMHGPYDLAKHPLAPFGMRICAYEAPEKRSSFGQRCAKGYLLGCSELHHRAWLVAIDKGGIRVSDTLAWFPRDYIMPGATPTERLDLALRDVASCAKSLLAELARGQDGSDRGVSQPSTRLKAIDALAGLYLPQTEVRAAAEAEEERNSSQQLRVPDNSSGGGSGAAAEPEAEAAAAGTPAGAEKPPAATGPPGIAKQGAAQVLRVAPPVAVEQGALASNSGASGAPTVAAAEPAAARAVHFSDVLGNKRPRPKKTKAQPHKAAAAPPAATAEQAATEAPLLQQQAVTEAEAADAASRKQPRCAKRQGKVEKPAYRNLPQGRNRRKRVRWPEDAVARKPQQEYVPATAEELAKYTVRQLKDLMRDHEISATACLTREDLVAAIMAAKVDVRHKLTARETLAHVRASTAGARATKAQRRRLANATRLHAAVATAARAAGPDVEWPGTEDSDEKSQPGDACAYATTDETTGETLVWRRLVRTDNESHVRWILATDQEWDRLIEETGTLEFIDPDQKEAGRKASYMSMAASLKPDAEGKLTVPRVRGAYGGNVTDYTGPRSANTASHAAVKTLLNAIVSDPTAKCMTADAKDFYLMTDLDKFEYMWIEPGQIPERTFLKYGLGSRKTSSKGQYMVRVRKGMYGLPHAGRIAAIKVTALLAKAGYHECRHNKMVFRHETRNVTFTLVVDDFLVKYSERADAEHLIKTLEEVYVMKTDWEAKKYLGITLQWDYVSEPRKVTLSMPNYAEKGIQRFSQWLGTERKVSHGPGVPAPRVYGVQPAKEQEEAPELPAEEKTELQRLVGYFRYYAEAIDSTQLVKLGQLATQQNRPTEATKREAAAFLDYVATWPNATLVFRASDMVLRSISDGSHRGEPQGGSRVGGIHFYGGNDCKDTNGAVQIVCKLLDVQSSSACETELGALYENGRVIAGLRTMASEFGYPQEKPTEVECDNKCAVGIACETEKQKRAAAMDMRFLWVADRVRQGQIRVTWSKGEENLADYVTKIHPHKHHREMRKNFVCDPPLRPPRQNAKYLKFFRSM